MKWYFFNCLIVGSLLIVLGCASTPKVVYFNDSDKIYPGFAFKDVCTSVNFDCVVMSKGMFRKITNVDPGADKAFRLVYE